MKRRSNSRFADSIFPGNFTHRTASRQSPRRRNVRRPLAMVGKTLVRAAVSGGWLALATPFAAAQPLPAPAPASGSEPPDIWHRDTLTGDWGGLRSDLAARGVTLTATYTGELLANVRG